MNINPVRPEFIRRLFFSSEERRLRAAWRLILQGVLLILFLIAFQYPTLLVLSRAHRLASPTTLLVSTVISCLAITASVFVSCRWLDRRSVFSLGLQLKSCSFLHLISGFILSGLMFGLIFAIQRLAGWLQIRSYAWEYQSWRVIGGSLLTMVIIFVLIGWQEELLARGYWLQNLSEGLNRSWGVLLSSAMFSLAHAANPHVSWEALLGLFASGIFLAFSWLRSRQLWLPVGLHIGWNFFEGVVFGFPVSGIVFFQLLRVRVNGPDFITGGAFGPEAGLILVPAFLLGGGLIYIFTRRQDEKGKKI